MAIFVDALSNFDSRMHHINIKWAYTSGFLFSITLKIAYGYNQWEWENITIITYVNTVIILILILQ